MNFDIHHLILYGIAAVALVVWLCGLQFLYATGRRSAGPAELFDDDADSMFQPHEATVRGFAQVPGQPAELAVRAATQLAQHGASQLGPVKILEQTDQRVLFEAMPHVTGHRFVGRGKLEFHGLPSGRTQIDYLVTAPKRTGLLFAGWVIQAAGLIVLIVGFTAMYLWVAPHPNPAVRWQSVQMAHVLHFLWPPFLCASLYRQVQTHVRNTMESLVHNLPFVQG